MCAPHRAVAHLEPSWSGLTHGLEGTLVSMPRAEVWSSSHRGGPVPVTEAHGWPRKQVFKKGFGTRLTCQELCNPILKTHCTDHHRRKEMFICCAWVVECWVIEKKNYTFFFFGFVIFSIEEKSEEKLFLGLNFVTGKKVPTGME